MNVHTMIGNVGQAPNFRKFDNGGEIASFSVATSERWTDKSGEKKERTTWHLVVVRNPYALQVARSIDKGDRVFIKGRVETRSYVDKDGKDRTITETVISFGDELQKIERISAGESRGRAAVDPVDDEIPF